MTTKLCYTVEKETYAPYMEEIETCSGSKVIRVYEIALDIPKLWFEVRAINDLTSIDAINNWLHENGFGNRQYKFIEL